MPDLWIIWKGAANPPLAGLWGERAEGGRSSRQTYVCAGVRTRTDRCYRSTAQFAGPSMALRS